MATINVFEAKAQFSRLIARAESGEEVIITRHGRSVARLMPMPRTQPDRVPGWAQPFEMPDDFDEWSEQDERDWFDESRGAHESAP